MNPYKYKKPWIICPLQQFPFITFGQPGFVIAYGPQPLVVHPSVAAPTAHAFEPSMFEQFQGTAVESLLCRNRRLFHQPYSTGDQFYGHYRIEV
uniref:Deleted in azoospermia-associated protein 2 n=1 Tax=Elaeophora elaphi TaxID=1147741 RepID=A0A0R3RNG5_9BILA